MSDPLTEMGNMIANIGQGQDQAQEEEQPNQQGGEEGEEEKTEPAIQMEEEMEEEEEMDIQFGEILEKLEEKINERISDVSQKLDGRLAEFLNDLGVKTAKAISLMDDKITEFDKITDSFQKQLGELTANNNVLIGKIKEANTTKSTSAATTTPIPTGQAETILQHAIAFNSEIRNQINLTQPLLLQIKNSTNSSRFHEFNVSGYWAVKNISEMVGKFCEVITNAVLTNSHLALLPKSIPLPPSSTATTLTTTTMAAKSTAMGMPLTIAAGMPSSSTATTQSSTIFTPMVKRKVTSAPNAPIRRRGRPTLDKDDTITLT